MINQGHIILKQRMRQQCIIMKDMMVMDIQKGIDLVNRLENTECLIIQKKDQMLISHESENFEDYAAK